MTSALTKKLAAATFTAAALTSGALEKTSATAFAAETAQTVHTQALQDAELTRARKELQRRLAYALDPLNHDATTRFWAIDSLVTDRYPALALEALKGLENAFKIAPMDEWPDLIEIIAHIAYTDLKVTDKIASDLIMSAHKNAMNALDVDNQAIRKNVLKIMAKTSLYMPETHPDTYPHLQATLRDTSLEGIKSADIVLDFLTSYTRKIAITTPETSLTPFYDLLKDRIEKLQATEDEYQKLSPEERYNREAEIYPLRANIEKSIRVYGYAAALLPQKTQEAQKILEQLLETHDSRYADAAFSSFENIAKKQPWLARSIVDKLFSFTKESGYEYSAFDIITTIGVTNKIEADYIIEALIKRAEEGNAAYCAGAMRYIAKHQPAEKKKTINQKAMSLLLNELKTGDAEQMASALIYMREESRVNKSFAAEWVATFKSLEDEKLTSWRLVEEISILGNMPEHNADAQELLTRALNKSIQDQNFALAQSLAEKIRLLKNMKAEPAPGSESEILRMPEEDGDLIPGP